MIHLVERIRVIRVHHIHLGIKSKQLKNMRSEKILQVVVSGRKPCCSSTRMWLRG